MDSSHAAPAAGHAPGEGHATVQTYVRVAVVLGILTAIEIGALYVPGLPKHLLVTLLLVFSVLKFALVAAWRTSDPGLRGRRPSGPPALTGPHGIPISPWSRASRRSAACTWPRCGGGEPRDCM